MDFDGYKKKALSIDDLSTLLEYLKDNVEFIKDGKFKNIDEDILEHWSAISKKFSTDVDEDGFDIELF